MEEKKSNKGLVFLVVVLAILFLGAVGYICYDKFLSDDSISEPVKEIQLSENEIMNLYNNITVNDEFGPYFESYISVDNIKADQFISYVMSNYINDNNIINGDFNFMCLTNKENDDIDFAKECNKTAASVSKIEIKNYVKKKYNIDKDFDLGEYYSQFLSNSKVQGYAYTQNEDRFYFGYIPGAQGEQKVFNKFIKLEQSNNDLYVYDKAVLCISGYDNVNCYKTFDDVNPDIDKSIYNTSGSAFKLSEDFVFEKVESKLNTYKHTFKKASDGKYYWYSSEPVNNN